MKRYNEVLHREMVNTQPNEVMLFRNVKRTTRTSNRLGPDTTPIMVMSKVTSPQPNPVENRSVPPSQTHKPESLEMMARVSNLPSHQMPK
jgi:hypothetical protein